MDEHSWMYRPRLGETKETARRQKTIPPQPSTAYYQPVRGQGIQSPT